MVGVGGTGCQRGGGFYGGGGGCFGGRGRGGGRGEGIFAEPRGIRVWHWRMLGDGGRSVGIHRGSENGKCAVSRVAGLYAAVGGIDRGCMLGLGESLPHSAQAWELCGMARIVRVERFVQSLSALLIRPDLWHPDFDTGHPPWWQECGFCGTASVPWNPKHDARTNDAPRLSEIKHPTLMTPDPFFCPPDPFFCLISSS